MADFTSLVNGWPFAELPDLRKRIQIAEDYAAAHTLSSRQQRVIEEMKKEAARKAETAERG